MVALVVDVRFLDDRYHGVPEWPPSPGRLFQALVAGISAGSLRSAEADDALRWIEALPPPIIIAPIADRGRGYTAYVPNNDGDAESDPTQPQRVGKQIRVLILPPDTSVSYAWDDIEAMPEGLPDLVHGLFQLGRGVDPAYASLRLVDLAEVEREAASCSYSIHRPGGAGADGVDCPMPGTLDTLDARFHAFRARLTFTGNGRSARVAFSNPPRARFARIVYDQKPGILLFDLRDSSGRFNPIDPAEAGRLIPDWLADAAARLGPGLAALAERFVLGLGAGPRDTMRRVRAFPVPTSRANGDRWIRRLAVEVPVTCPIRREDLAWAFQGSEGFSERWGRPEPTSDRSMLRQHLGSSHIWRSETAVVLPVVRRRLGDGETKAGTERAAEDRAARAAVATALRHAGITARIANVRVQQEPFDSRGTMAEAFTGDPRRFPKHAKWHVEIAFAEPIQGPLILGNGRFAGLGLMRPVEDSDAAGIIAFRIASGLTVADPLGVAQSLRRAMLARAGDEAPPLVTGHATSTTPLRTGDTAHVACLADLPRGRLMVVAPHRIDHRKATASEAREFADLRSKMQGMTELLAGAAGRLRLLPDVIAQDDPVFGSARCWESVTPYRVTRHAKGVNPEHALMADVMVELRRRGRPEAQVTVLECRAGPNGGITGRLRLTFAATLCGPLLLGQTRQKGGGLFATGTGPGG